MGFRAAPRDQAGGDPRPDVYVMRRDVATVGYGATYTNRGSYIVVDNRLDPRTPKATLTVGVAVKALQQGLWSTVTHEMFHVIQGAYLPRAQVPLWIKEGTANAMSGAALYDRSWPKNARDAVDSWLRQSWRPLPSIGSEYSAIIWEYFLAPYRNRDAAHICDNQIACLLDTLAQRVRENKGVGNGIWALDEVLRKNGEGSFSEFFVRVADSLQFLVGEHWPPYPLDKALESAGSTPKTFSTDIEPYSIQQIPLPVIMASTPVSVIASVGSSDVVPLVYYGGTKGVRMTPIERQTTADNASLWTFDPTRVGNSCAEGAEVVSRIAQLFGLDCKPGRVDFVVVNPSGRTWPVDVLYIQR
jgi:hypothetical protein